MPDATHPVGSEITVTSILSLSSTFITRGPLGSCTLGTVNISLFGPGGNLSVANDNCQTATQEERLEYTVIVGDSFPLIGYGGIHTESTIDTNPNNGLLWYGSEVTIDATQTGSLGFISPVAISAASGVFYDVEIVDDGGNGGGSVPEPGTLALLGLGLAGLVASRRRKQ